MLNDLRLRLLALIRPRRVEREVDEELRFHIELEVERYVRGGLDRSEAERRVRLEFGGSTRSRKSTGTRQACAW